MSIINKDHLKNALEYEEYSLLIHDLVDHGKTSGADQSASLVEYTKINRQRMSRLDKTIRINEETVEAIKKIKRVQYWVVLTESWCGDAAQNIPILAKMAGLNSKIKLGMLFRDENPEIMDAYLTKGSRSIPKLIALDHNMEEIFTWGPRPEEAQVIINKWKNSGSTDKEEGLLAVQKWYNEDAGECLQEEFVDLLSDEVE